MPKNCLNADECDLDCCPENCSCGGCGDCHDPEGDCAHAREACQ